MSYMIREGIEAGSFEMRWGFHDWHARGGTKSVPSGKSLGTSLLRKFPQPWKVFLYQNIKQPGHRLLIYHEFATAQGRTSTDGHHLDPGHPTQMGKPALLATHTTGCQPHSHELNLDARLAWRHGSSRRPITCKVPMADGLSRPLHAPPHIVGRGCHESCLHEHELSSVIR